MNEHGPEHEELIERWFTETDAPSASEIERLMDACPMCREQITSMDEVRRSLTAAAELERDVLAEASQLEGRPADGGSSTRDPLRPASTWWRRPSRWVPIAAAALLAITVSVALRLGGAPNPTPPVVPNGIMLGGEVTLTAPIGDVASFDAFSWTAQGSGATFQIEVFDADDLTTPLLTSPVISGRTWTPDATTTLPPSIRWTLTRFDIDGERDGTVSVDARRTNAP
ncbi:MAG: hypothetical protein AB8G96_17030 [Phycisphaerales bacterium]